MFTLENLKLSKSLVIASALFAAANLGAANIYKITGEKAVDGSVIYPEVNGQYTAYRVNTQKDFKNGNYAFGRIATPNEITAWDRDVMPDGTGLPMYDVDKNGQSTGVIAKGSVEWGDELYVRDCQICHGDFGIGGTGYPPLNGGGATNESLSIQHLNPAHDEPNTENPKKTIGTNWPYASTLFWYIQSAMPFPHPKSLSNSETYAITAYMLSVNEVTLKDGTEMDDEFVLQHSNFQDIKMPNVNGFYPEVDAPGGQERMKAFLSDANNYGKGTRCMSDCNDYKMLEIKGNIDNFFPPASTERSLPKIEKKAALPGEDIYNASCASCHDSDALGAPTPGKNDQWTDMFAERDDATILHNAIVGLNAMPPRGGTDLSDEKMKEVVDFMINTSK